jgi:hypothetical protein
MSMNARIATPKAEGFLRAFLESYKDCRQSYTEPEWELVWSASEVWNCLMPWTTTRPELARESSEPVLAKVAEKLGLDYWEREPLGLDGALYPKGGNVDYGFPFPILVAIEHENDRTGFISEVQKLLSVRCPLKVGITYVLGDTDSSVWLAVLGQQAKRKFERIAQFISEDPATEYLLLVGCEEEPHEIKWYYSILSPAAQPDDFRFLPCDGCSTMVD